MVISNLMNLSGIDPKIFIDGSWRCMLIQLIGLWCLMYGMGTFADGGIFQQALHLRFKLYASNTIIKKVIGVTLLTVSIGILLKNVNFFKTNPRLSLMVNALNKINPERKKLISAELKNL